MQDGSDVMAKMLFKNFQLDRWELLIRIDYSASPAMNVTLSFDSEQLMESHFQRFTRQQAEYFYACITSAQESIPHTNIADPGN